MKMKILAALLWACSSAPVGAFQYRVVEGNSMWLLAEKYYGSARAWRRIARANPEVKDPHWIYPGQMIEIPEAEAPSAPAPVETAAPVQAPAPPPAPPAPAPAPQVPDKPIPAPAPRRQEKADASEGLSAEFPPGMTSLYTTLRRVQVPRRFKPDAVVIERATDMDALATTGDQIRARLERPMALRVGDRFVVYRQAARWEEEDDKSHYLQEIGVVELKRHLRAQDYLFSIVSTADAVLSGDWLKLEEEKP